MSVAEHLTVQRAALSDEALAGLRQVIYCAGVRCELARNLASEVQEDGIDIDVEYTVAHKVGHACLGCTEVGVRPRGLTYSQAEIDAILAETVLH